MLIVSGIIEKPSKSRTRRSTDTPEAGEFFAFAIFSINIDGKIAYIESGGQLDTLLIAIADSPSLYGPFTLIEGNKRAVAFARQNTLTGSLFFVGYSPCVVNCVWTRHTYRQFLSSRRSMQHNRAEPVGAVDQGHSGHIEK